MVQNDLWYLRKTLKQVRQMKGLCHSIEFSFEQILKMKGGKNGRPEGRAPKYYADMIKRLKLKDKNKFVEDWETEKIDNSGIRADRSYKKKVRK